MQIHAPFATIAKEETKAAKRAAREEVANEDAPAANSKGKTKEIAIEELWKPSGGATAFWEACGVEYVLCTFTSARLQILTDTRSKSSLHHPASLKSAVEDYIVAHRLVDPKNHRMVVLDEELGRAVGVKKPSPAETMARDEILRKLRAGVAWSVSIGGVIKSVRLSLSRHRLLSSASALCTKGSQANAFQEGRSATHTPHGQDAPRSQDRHPHYRSRDIRHRH